MDIDKMEAGPEMDALVAERVMGWTAERKPGLPHLWLPPGHFISGWSPSTDISAAWQVVEKMLEKHEAFHLEYIPDKQWYAMFWFATYFTSADTAPLAICRAALKAVVDVV